MRDWVLSFNRAKDIKQNELGHILIVGNAGTGKTTTIKSLIQQILTHSPKHIIRIINCGGWNDYSSFEGIPEVKRWESTLPDEQDRYYKLRHFLFSVISLFGKQRSLRSMFSTPIEEAYYELRQRIEDVKISSRVKVKNAKTNTYESAIGAEKKFPRYFIFIDDFATFSSSLNLNFEDPIVGTTEDKLLKILRMGPQVGIYCVIANQRYRSVPSKFKTLFKYVLIHECTKLELSLIDSALEGIEFKPHSYIIKDEQGITPLELNPKAS